MVANIADYRKKKKNNDRRNCGVHRMTSVSTDEIGFLMECISEKTGDILANPLATEILQNEIAEMEDFEKRYRNCIDKIPEPSGDRIVYLLAVMHEISKDMFRSKTGRKKMDLFYDFEDFYHPYLDMAWSDYMDEHPELNTDFTPSMPDDVGIDKLKEMLDGAISRIMGAFPDDSRFKQQAVVNGMWELFEVERNIRYRFCEENTT